MKDKEIEMSAEEASRRVKGFALNAGADLVGITEINPLWVYSHRGEIFHDLQGARSGYGVTDPGRRLRRLQRADRDCRRRERGQFSERLGGPVAARHDLPLFFDASHAFGCTHDDRPIGSCGDAEVFSFHSTKVFHTFEGGAVTTNDDRLADELRLLRNFGFRDFDDVGGPGINGKMPEICAAMGLANLEAFGATIDASRVTFERYREGLAGIPGLTLRDYET